MNPLSRFLKAIGFQGQGGTGSPEMFSFGQNFNLWNQFFQSSTKLDFSREVGDLRNSALVMAGYTWVATNAAGARPYVCKIDSDNKEDEIRDHPLIELLDEPNPYYGFDELISGISFSWLTASTAYLIVNRNMGGGVAELYYEPHWSIRPYWDGAGTEWISGYEIQRGGKWAKMPAGPQDPFVISFLKGVDAETRTGMSPTSSLIREYYTDQQAAHFSALLMRQGLVPPVVVSLGDKDAPVTPENVKVVKDKLIRLMSGDKAGEPLVMNHPSKVERLGFDYSSVGLRDIRQIPEERFCAAMGISPHSLNFGTAAQTSTYSNVEQYLRQDYRSYIVPFHRYIAKVLQRRLLPEFGETEGLRVKWDYAEVPLMQPDLTAEWTRVGMAYKDRILDQAEAREAIGYKFEDKHVDVYYPVPSSNITLSPMTERPKSPAPAQLNPGKPPADDDEDEAPESKEVVLGDTDDTDAGELWWRKHAPEAAKNLIDARIKPNGSAKPN
jgi:HK97 family phage portal protein